MSRSYTQSSSSEQCILNSESCCLLQSVGHVAKVYSATAVHERFVQTQHRLRENVQEADALPMKELKSFSKTRWCCQAEARDAVIATLGSNIDCFEFFAEKNNPDRRVAVEIIVGFIDTDFIANLVLFQDILRKSRMTANTSKARKWTRGKLCNSLQL